jgi:hypothetical protein
MMRCLLRERVFDAVRIGGPRFLLGPAFAVSDELRVFKWLVCSKAERIPLTILDGAADARNDDSA